jgi:hypothetical protein
MMLEAISDKRLDDELVLQLANEACAEDIQWHFEHLERKFDLPMLF